MSLKSLASRAKTSKSEKEGVPSFHINNVTIMSQWKSAGVPRFRPILSAIGTPTLAKFLVPILTSLTVNDYTVKDSFTFSDEICLQNSAHFMASLDVDALFTNIH